MHPAYSIIAFTTLTGAGYGLMGWLGLGFLNKPNLGTFITLVITFGLVGGGLLCSTMHLGNPQRFLMAFSQWRSSWLSREGVAAIATFVPAGLFGLLWLFMGTQVAILGFVMALFAVVTVFCTSMIYASIKTVQHWTHPLVTPLYLAFAASTGGLFALALGADIRWWVALALIIAWVLKLAYWFSADRIVQKSTAETATGLGHLGKVTMLEPPHTNENYLLKEMGYRVARKHSQKLRIIALVCGLVVPIIFLLLGFTLLFWAAAIVGLIGQMVERWLFFAEAKHSVGTYYGLS